MTDERSEWSLLKPEQIPDKSIEEARKAWLESDDVGDSDWRKAIAAAINAWRPYHVIGKDDLFYMEKRTICLRLPEDKNDD